MYNVVLIGCGHMGAVHLDDIYTMENINVYGVADLDAERARLFARKYGADSFDTDYMRYLRDEKTDIVICATYPATHLEILKQCVQYKKHLLCEKPMTASLAEAEEFVELARNGGIKVQVGYILRYNETYRKVAGMIQAGAIGKPLVIRMAQNHHVMDWRKYRALLKGSSPIVDCGVHYIDVCRWFTGAEIESVDGICATLDQEVPENAFNYGLMTMRLTDGSVAYYEAGWGNSIAADNLKEFIGPRGRIKIVEREHRLSCQEEGDLIEYYDSVGREYRTINVNCKRRPTGAQLAHLIEMIEDGVPSVPSIDDVYMSYKIAVSADQKLRRKKLC